MLLSRYCCYARKNFLSPFEMTAYSSLESDEYLGDTPHDIEQDDRAWLVTAYFNMPP